MWAAWLVVEWAGRVVGLTGLGLACAWGGWELGACLRGPGFRGLWRLGLGFHVWCLRLGPRKAHRMVALGRLADWLQPSSDWWGGVLEDLGWRTDYPDLLVRTLLNALWIGGATASPPLLRLLDSPYFRPAGQQMSVAGRWRLLDQVHLFRRFYVIRYFEDAVKEPFHRLTRVSLIPALKGALAAPDLRPELEWQLLGLAPSLVVPLGSDLRRTMRLACLRLPLSRAERQTALSIWLETFEVTGPWPVSGGQWPVAEGPLVGQGVFVMAERLLRLQSPPFDRDTLWVRMFGHERYSEDLDKLLRQLRMFLDTSFWSPNAAPLEAREETERLMAWREQGLGPALRALLLKEPEPQTVDLRPAARDLLDLADGLIRQQPGVLYASSLPTEIRFPDH